jgi:hypothetical protein
MRGLAEFVLRLATPPTLSDRLSRDRGSRDAIASNL